MNINDLLKRTSELLHSIHDIDHAGDCGGTKGCPTYLLAKEIDDTITREWTPEHARMLFLQEGYGWKNVADAHNSTLVQPDAKDKERIVLLEGLLLRARRDVSKRASLTAGCSSRKLIAEIDAALTPELAAEQEKKS